jgi:hypothetical protein
LSGSHYKPPALLEVLDLARPSHLSDVGEEDRKQTPSVIASHKERVDGQACKDHDKVYAEQSHFLFSFQFLAALENMPPTEPIGEVIRATGKACLSEKEPGSGLAAAVCRPLEPVDN